MESKGLALAAATLALAAGVSSGGAPPPYRRRQPMKRTRATQRYWAGRTATKGPAGGRYKGSSAAKRATRRGGNPAVQH